MKACGRGMHAAQRHGACASVQVPLRLHAHAETPCSLQKYGDGRQSRTRQDNQHTVAERCHFSGTALRCHARVHKAVPILAHPWLIPTQTNHGNAPACGVAQGRGRSSQPCRTFSPLLDVSHTEHRQLGEVLGCGVCPRRHVCAWHAVQTTVEEGVDVEAPDLLAPLEFAPDDCIEIMHVL